ncbi:MAG: hypothetical protein J7L44_00980 [Candidatus Diapherotrites archaeon]|nr:hypothetical protein [Candidatus Diapherotrites archaeon]
MGKRFPIVALGLFVVLFVFLLGCTMPPIKTETQELTFVFKEDGSIYAETVNYGKLMSGTQAGMELYGSAEDWESDCKKQLQDGLNEYKMMLAMAAQSQDLNKEQQEQMEKIAKLIETIESTMQCEFKANKDDNTAMFRMGYELDKESLDMLKVALQQQGQASGKALFPVITETDEGMHVEIPVNIQQPSTVELKKIKIKAEGEIANFSPENYTKEGDYYVFTDIESLSGSKISFDYKPSVAAPEPQAGEETPEEESPAGTGAEGTEKPSTGAAGGKEKFSLLGIELPLSPELMLYLLVAIIALIALIILIAFIRSRQGKGKVAAPEILEKKPGEVPITGTHKEKPKTSQVLDLKESVEGGAKARPVSESDIIVETRKEPVHEEPKAEPVHEEPKAKPEPGALSEADMKTVERAVMALAPKKDKYTPEQLRKVMLEMGYKKEVANEIIKRLYE